MSRVTASRAGSIAWAIVLLSVQGHSQQTPSPVSIPETPYLDVARQVARQLKTMERQEAFGVSWRASNVSASRSTGIDSGAAGIGWFHLELFRATGDSEYLATAGRAADFVGNRYRQSQFGGPDWLGGAAGGGAFLLAMFEETQNEAFLDHAVHAADWLIQTSLAANGGRYWRHGPNVPNTYTGLYHGAAGIGIFLLDVHAHTGDARYLNAARDAARWLEAYMVRLGPDAWGWKRLTTDAHAYHHLCGGSTGIMPFFQRLWDVTADERYLTLFMGTANGMLRSAQTDAGGQTWTYTSANSGNPPIIFCHGASSAAAALRAAYDLTGDPRYRAGAKEAARWTIAVALTAGEGERFWAHIARTQQFETGYRTGTASVGHALLRLHHAEPDEAYLDAARGAAGWLLAIADRPGHGRIRWINYTGAPHAGSVQDYRNGWYAGAAGIGLFFIELDAVLRGRPVPSFEVW